MLSPTRERLERYFEFDRLGTNWRTELLAGITKFMTMAYIIFENPSILRETGLPYQASVGATCFCAGFAGILMGAFARYPITLAPGMGPRGDRVRAADRVDSPNIVGSFKLTYFRNAATTSFGLPSRSCWAS